jgi:hypothetical protein
MTYLQCLNEITNFEETKKILENKKLSVKEYGNLFIVKYDKTVCDMNDKDVKKCRGLILEKNTNKLVCVPPPKAEKIEIFNNVPIEKTIYEEFIEGTMINIFKYDGKVYMATRSCIDALCHFYSNKTFNALFSEVIELSNFDSIDDNMNLSFVLQHPENTIVTQYEKPEITLVYGVTIDGENIVNYNLQELKHMLKDTNKDLDFKIPNQYNVKSHIEVYDILNGMKHNEPGVILKNSEFNYLKSKIWNQHYSHVRQLKGNSSSKKYMYLELRKNNAIKEYLNYFPDDAKVFETYRLELYDTTTKLFNFYQNWKVRKNSDGIHLYQKVTEIDYEYRPLCIDLHEAFKQTKKITDKRAVINYIKNLPIAKLLFVINYKYRST